MQLTNENKENLTKKDKKISVNYAFPEYKTYKKENGDEVELTIYEEPRWSFKDKNELFEIIKESDEDFYNEIKSIIEEYPNRKFDFDLGKSFNYSDELIYFRDFSKETLNEKLNNEFIVRYWTTDDTFENKLPQISNFDSAGESSTIINLNEELSEKLNSMVRDHVKNNIERFEQYKTYRNEKIRKVLHTEIKQHGEPIVSVEGNGKINASFQTFTISDDLHNLLNLPHISWHDAQTGKTYPYQYVLYADFELDENSIDETKEPQIKYFEYVDNGEKEIYTVDSEKKDLSVLVNTDSMKIVTQVFKEIANDYYNQGKQYMQEQKDLTQEETRTQIETKYTKADINDLQNFFFSYPQLSESLCYQILDDFELYQIPLFKDSDGNIYQREMNKDLAEGDERDYQLLTQDGIIDQEYNWLIDRKYTPEDEIDFQKEIEDFRKELEDIKKFEENPKSYYKNIFKVALEKEIEKVKKEINEGNVKDVIEKNILEIAEEKVGSHAVPEEIIGWYISDDEKNYFENWKNSGDFPYYKEALDAMFAYVYEHDTTKQKLRYISELNETTQNELRQLIKEHYESEGLSEVDIEKAIENAMNSKIDDLNQLMESNEKINKLLLDKTNEEPMIKIVHEIDSDGLESLFEYDDKGNLIHSRYSDGSEKWYEYDDKGNEIHSKYSIGYESWYEYNDKGNLIHSKDSNGFESWYEYDSNGNEIHLKDSAGYERWSEYDSNGNQIHFKSSDGYEEWNKYDDKGNKVHYKDSDGIEVLYEYDNNGNNIHSKNSNGFEKWTEYDSNGNEIHFKTSDGFEKWTEYDSNGNEIHFKTSDGDESWFEYDNKGNLINSTESDGYEVWNNISYVSLEEYKKMQNTSIEVKENKQKFFGAIELWNNNKKGTNSEFKPIGTLVEVNPSDEQQCESLRKNTSFIDIYDAELILGMINYDKDSFEFMLDIDNGNFVEIDRKNNKIIDVTDTEGALRYLRDEINYRTQDVVEESFTVEEIAAANRLIRSLEFIDNKNRQKILEKNIYVVEEGVVTGSREPSFVPYNEFASKRLLDKTFTTKEACEIFCRKENAFQIAKAHIDEVDNSKEYSEAEKEKYVKVYFEQLEKNWDEYDNQAPSYKELEILIKGLDAFNRGEESLTFTRPDADDIENGFDNGWDFSEICKGYAEFADGYNESNVICRLDDMMIFDSDSDAALQAKKDGYKFLEVGKDIIFPKEILNDDIEYRNYIDTPENRKILNEYLREDLKMGKKENFELKVGDRILISDDDLYAEYGRVHSEELGYYDLSCFEIEKISKQKDKVMLKRFSGGHIPQEAFEIEKLIKNKEELDEYLSTISTGKGFLLENNGDIRANNQIRIIPITTVKEHEFNDSYIVSGTGGGTFGEFEITNLENQTLRKNPMLCNFDYRKDVKSASDFLANFTNIRDNLIIEQAPDVYLKEYESNDLTVNNETLTFGQFNSETNELKLIKEAYFKELVIDENDASKNKVVLGFKENGQEQLLEMGEVEYKNLLNAFGFSKEQQDKSLEINKYKTFAEKEPEVVFDMIKSDYLGGTPFSDNELIGYLKGLKKSNNYHHYLDKLLFESLEQSDETLFSKVVDAGADITWRREENGEPINVLHYAAADNLDIAIKKIIEKTKSLEVNDYINLFSEEDFEGLTPLEIAISYSGGEYFGCTKLLIDAMDDEGFSGVEDLLFEDKLGNKVLYTSKDNLDCVSILCFDGNNNIISADTESLVDEKSLGEIVSEDLIYQTNNDFLKGNIELNRSSKLISELKEVPQKLWNDEINHRILLTIPNTFDPQQSFYDFDSILALEKIKKSLFVEFDNQKESLLQGFYTKVEFMDSFSEKELSFEDFQTCGLINFFKDDYWSPVHKSLKFEIADLCFDKKVHELFNSISPRPTDMGMCKNNDYTWLSLNMNDACNNRPITEGEAEIILKYIQYEDYNFYRTVDEKLCMLDVSEDFTGEGEIMTPEKIVDMAHRMMVKARDLEYSIYDEKDEKVINDLQERFGLIEEQKIESSKDEELKKQETSVVEQFFSKLKDSLYDNAKLEDVLKSAATVLQTFSDTEKKEISQYLHNKGASSGDRVGKVLSSILEINEQKQTKKRSKTDDDTRGM